MSDKLFYWLSFGSAVTSGLVAGILYGFSSFIMPALARLPVPQGVAAFQSINATVETRSFLILFTGTAITSLVLFVMSILRWGTPGAFSSMLGALSYFFGMFVWTIAFHLPKNAALDKLAADSAEAATYWERFVPVWTAGNTFRTAAGIVATIAFVYAAIEARAAR